MPDDNFLDRLARVAEDLRVQETTFAGSPIIRPNKWNHVQSIAEHLNRGGHNWGDRIDGSVEYGGNIAGAWTMGGLAAYMWDKEHGQELVGNTKFHTAMRILRKRVGAQSAVSMYNQLKCGGLVNYSTDYPATPPLIVDVTLGGGYTKANFQPILLPGRPPLRSGARGAPSLYLGNQPATSQAQVNYLNKNSSGGYWDQENNGLGWSVQVQAGDLPFEIYPGSGKYAKVIYPYSYSGNNTYAVWGFDDDDLIVTEPPYTGSPGVQGRGYTELGGTPNLTSPQASPLKRFTESALKVPAALQDPMFSDIVAWYEQCTEEYMAGRQEVEDHVWMPFSDFWSSFDYVIRHGWVHLRGRIVVNGPAGNATYMDRFPGRSAVIGGNGQDVAPNYPGGKGEFGDVQFADAWTAVGTWKGKPAPVNMRNYYYYSNGQSYIVMMPQPTYPGQNYVDVDGISWPCQ